MVLSAAVFTAVGYWAAFLLRFEFAIPASRFQRLVETLPYLLIVRLALAHRFRLDRGYWQHVGIQDVLQITAAISFGSLLFPAVLLAVGQLGGIPVSVLVLEWLLALAMTGGVRFAVRLVRERQRRVLAPRVRRSFIVGAGEAGEQILRQLLHTPGGRYHVVGLIDDDPAKQGRALHGVPVVGTSDQLRGMVSLHRVQHVLIAIPSATTEQLRVLAERCMDAGVEVQLLPPLRNLVTGEVRMSQVRDVRIEDLLGRQPVELDLESIPPEVAGRVVAVTGAGGSIGSELARQVARFRPRSLVLLDRAESPLHYIHHEIARDYPDISVVPVLASVTNEERLQAVFDTHRPDLVFHAAAYKHVPMLEWNVVEGVWNNVFGTLCAARCAARVGAGKFVLISTDKAVNPTSVLGVTKLIAERVVLELPSLRSSATDFRVVRFGNVLGSDGSVVPMFQRQLAAGGPLTVTHPEVRRYFMTIPEAVQLVLQVTALPEATGRIAVLEMGTQVKIADLAHQMIRLAGLLPQKDVEIVFTGLRPGEKLEEELIGPGESATPTSIDKIRVIDRSNGHGEELARRLRYLTQVTTRHDAAALLRALGTLAPEYQPGLSPFEAHPAGANGNGNGNGNGHGSLRFGPPRTRRIPLRARRHGPGRIPPAAPDVRGGTAQA
ncbi:MAG TPA: nucleoside-diphosphate sugar epimerase/dehydratase [Gemmatimonadales bacterium]|nr:nucleoside-diphosphate sugar epimerase/dehydratase [Gemmatimonadales bacterium]